MSSAAAPTAGPASVTPLRGDPNHLGHSRHGSTERGARGHGTGGPASKRIVVAYGFWIFILSDIVMFAAFFASYAVLQGATADGPKPAELFDLNNVALETALLLLSSFVCGMAALALAARRMLPFQAAMALTFLLGAGFVALEANEFYGLVERGAGPSQSAFLTAFFTLVGCHGLHVSVGLLWLLTMMAQVLTKGFRADIVRRTLCFTLFWHALDIVWVGVFSIVYLIGVIP